MRPRQTLNVCPDIDTCTTDYFTPSGGGPTRYDTKSSQMVWFMIVRISVIMLVYLSFDPLLMASDVQEHFLVPQLDLLLFSLPDVLHEPGQLRRGVLQNQLGKTSLANVVECAALSYHFTQNVHGGNCVPPDSDLVCPVSAWHYQQLA
ncbi:uncharacterized protein F5891DRAFT_978330 [Suillus fuscotomentosus]|uniref:Uncharacterized protein n=1 Tax=Suillus fuscotomentosus TaxID=1912939 RepID=A0AAD4EB16_9AGAM|nr:uncharacterized protein F5891DRAFT_978330 [Suillus fuscotomentosus]KAG1902857.1 hypothetical protein F5891DRAFT_978330 [Suillus fuscotomentosus]